MTEIKKLLSMTFRYRIFKIGGWEDDLIWCPSQCYLEFWWRGKRKTLYLRWRWDDPWTGSVIHGANDHDLPYNDWTSLKLPHFGSEDNLNDLKKAAITAAKKTLTAGRPEKE